MLKVLIADENQERAELLAHSFNRNGCSAACISPEKNSIRRYLKRHRPEAVILVYNLSEKKLLNYLNQAKKEEAVVISAIPKDSEVSRLIKVLSDMVIDLDELNALEASFITLIEEKINSLQHAGEKRHGYRFGLFFADVEKGVVLFRKKRMDLTPTEYQIFLLLMMAGGEPVAHSELMKQIWGTVNLSTRSLSVHINNLRKKIRALFRNYDIETVRGRGYRLIKKP